MNIDYKMIGARIKQARKTQGMTQEALAERLDVTVGYVSQFERGITKISLDLLGSISAVLDCDVAELVSETATRSERYMENEFLDEIRLLDTKKKKFLLRMIKALNEDL